MTITPEKMMAALKRSRELWLENGGRVDPNWDQDFPGLQDSEELRAILSESLHSDPSRVGQLVMAIQYFHYATIAEPAEAAKFRIGAQELLQQLRLGPEDVEVFLNLFSGSTSGY